MRGRDRGFGEHAGRGLGGLQRAMACMARTGLCRRRRLRIDMGTRYGAAST
ncbi:hypothetical protein SAOR_05000 [Salinisphaera orenii MK-B5]|uniref:Uncharacterized protein n=1 Tax=Salinisphaera orenii MK-B5 TaxID=856730 RepID=A0A423PTQ9_9GAMM|nr:hypothetical protein SAOR_05000 [Salinisphaera orenii MK-B5]